MLNSSYKKYLIKPRNKKPKILLISLPFENKIAETFVIKSLKLLKPLCSKLILITVNFPVKMSNKVTVINIKFLSSHEKMGVWFRTLRMLLIQLRISLRLTKVFSQIDIVLFHLGGELNILPLFCSKLFKKKTAIFYYGVQKSWEKKLNEPSRVGKAIFPFFASVLERTIFRLVDQIIVEAESIIKQGPFGKYKSKVTANGAFYVDTNHFSLKRELKNRKKLIGLVCSLVPKKGVDNLIDAIPLILAKLPDVEFLIGGAGPLFDTIKERVGTDQLRNKVNLTGWLSNEQVVEHLNRMKLFILPSYEEGLPNIILEAQACGTPVLATPVGGIPEVIKDEETGFILEDNSAESITRGVLRALNHPRLLEITKKARVHIEQEYSYEAAVKRYKRILISLR